MISQTDHETSKRRNWGKKEKKPLKWFERSLKFPHAL